MKYREIFVSAVKALLANKLRSLLSTIGIAVGIAAVIVIISVGNGVSIRVMNAVYGLGVNTLDIETYSDNEEKSRELQLSDVAALAAPNWSQQINAVVPVSATSAQLDADSESADSSVIGTYPDYFRVTGNTLAKGTYFTQADELIARKVVILGPELAEKLFADVDPIAKQVAINGINFTVIGVIQSKGAMWQSKTDFAALVPLATVQRMITGSESLSRIMVQAVSTDELPRAKAVVEQVLRVDNNTAGVAVTDSRELLNQSKDIIETLKVLLIAISAITLTLGGIGITNIMLVAVTERTREIGIRKAIGATKSAIMGQFLVEATLLSLVGGLIGVMAGLVISQYEFYQVQLVMLPSSIPLAVAVSVSVGIIFGAIPAYRAASLHPIQALRRQ